MNFNNINTDLFFYTTNDDMLISSPKKDGKGGKRGKWGKGGKDGGKDGDESRSWLSICEGRVYFAFNRLGLMAYPFSLASSSLTSLKRWFSDDDTHVLGRIAH